MLLLSLKMTSPLDCPAVYSDPVSTEPKNSRNAVTQQTTNIHLKGRAMHQISSMTNHTTIRIQVKITSIFPEMICAMKLTLLIKMTARQNHVTIKVSDMIQSQLHLQK